MPVTYNYDSENRILHCQVGGELLISEVVEYFRTAYQDERIQDGSIEVVHLDQVSEFNVRAQDVRDVEPQLRDYLVGGKFVASVFIGLQPLQVGIANMLSGMLTTMFPEYPAPVVGSEEEALEEIGSIRRGTGDAAESNQETV